MILVGKKEFIGVEYRILDEKRGYSKIWLGGNSLGTCEDIIYLTGYLVGGLKYIDVNQCIYGNVISDTICNN